MPTYNNNLLPDTHGRDLGSQDQRWDAFLQDVDIEGTLLINGSPVGESGHTATADVAALATRSAIQDKGFVNVVTDYGCPTDRTSDCYAIIQQAIDENPGKTICLPKLTSLDFPAADYQCSQQLVLSGKGTGLKGLGGGMPRFSGGGVAIKFPSGVAGVRMDATNTCGYLGYLQIWGGDAFSRSVQSTYEDFPNESSLQGNSGIDGVQVLGGEQNIEHVMAYAFKRHGFYINGSSSGQPDLGRYVGLYANANRGYGIYTHGVDANISTYQSCNLWFNALGGIRDGAQYGNTFIAPHSSGNASFAAIAAGTNKTISSIVVASNVATITTSTAHGWSAGQWITTVPTDGTFASTAKLLTASGSTATYNFTKADSSTGAGGTAATSTALQILAYYQSTALLLVGAYVSPAGTVGAWITPYAESNQLAPLLNDSMVWNPQGLVPTSGNMITANTLIGMFARAPFFTFRPTTSTGCFQVSDPAFTYDAWSFSADGLLKFKGAANNAHAASGLWRVLSAFTMNARNNANNADVNLISKNASDVVAIGGSAGVTTSGTVAVTGAVTATTGMTIGTSGTALTQAKVYSQSLDVGSVSANTTAEFDFTVTGLATSDKVFVNKPSHTAGLVLSNARVKAADTLSLTFGNLTGSPIDPGAETYLITAIRS
jgi:hypothetical protein